MMSAASTGTELTRFKKGTLPKLALVVLLFIPLIYGALYLWAFWAPTDELKNLPVALVNEDAGTTLDDGTRLTAGDGVSDELLDRKDLDWQLVDAADARTGVASGDYYFSVTIPENFSARAASPAGDAPEQAMITVDYNDGNNFLASTLGRSAMMMVEQAVTEKISAQTAETMLVGVNTLSDGLRQASDGAHTLADGSGALDEGANTLLVGLGTLTEGIGRAAEGSGALAAGSRTLAGGMNELALGNGVLADGARQLSARTDALPGSIAQLDGGARELADRAQALPDQANRLNAGAQELASQTSALPDQLARLDAGAQELQRQTNALPAQAQGLHDSASALAAGAARLPTALGALGDGGRALEESGSALATQAAPALRGLDGLAALAAANPQMTVSELDAALGGPGSIARLTGGAHAAVSGAETIGQSAAQLGSGAAGAVAGSRDLAAQLDRFVAEGTAPLAAQAPALSQGVSQIAGGTAQLNSRMPALAGGLGELAGGTAQLAEAAPALTDGISRLAGGTGALNAQIPALKGGIDELAGGAARAQSGASTLNTGAGTLASSAGQLAGALGDAVPGAEQLRNGGQSLTEGTGALVDGTDALAGKLGEGAEKAPSYTGTELDAMTSVVGAPVGLDEQHVHEAKSFGEGFAPFFLALATFVGALITWLILRALPTRALASRASGLRATLTGFLPAALIGVGQVVIMMLVLVYGIGLQPDNWVGTSLFVLLTTFAFLSLQQMFIILLGSAAGRVVSLVLLMLQLSSSGGTYPVETTPGFFQVLHPFMPATYVVNGLRALITGGIDERFWIALAYMIGLLVISFAISAIAAGRQKVWTMKRLSPELAI